jgi:hypothetical protein
MKKFILVMTILILISTIIYAKYPKEQLVLLQDLCTSGSSIMEYNGKFAWVLKTTRYNEEIFYYDGLQTNQLTNDNNQGVKEILDFTSGEILYSDTLQDKVSGNNIYSLYLYKNGSKIDLSNNNKFNGFAKRFEDRICWISGPVPGSSKNEIYLYQNNEIKKITDNTYSEIYLCLNKDYIIWVDSGSYDVENRFFIYKGGNTTELPVDILGYGFTLNDKGIVWRGCDGGPNCDETPDDLDHEIFFYDFDKITQITDTLNRIEKEYMITNELIFVLSTNESWNEVKFNIFNYKDEKIFEEQIPGFSSFNSLELKDDKAIFQTSGNMATLYYFDGKTVQTIYSGHYFYYSFAIGGFGYSYSDEDGNFVSYLYKDGTKELISFDINGSVGFLENYLLFYYTYPNTSVYKLMYLDQNLPYIQITGNESTKLQKGDTLKLSLTVKNQGPDHAVDIYIVEISGEYPFQMFRFLNPDGFKFQLYGYKNVMLPKDLDLTFEFYSAKIGDIPDAPLNKVSYMVIPTHAGTFIPLTAFPSTLSYELVK